MGLSPLSPWWAQAGAGPQGTRPPWGGCPGSSSGAGWALESLSSSATFPWQWKSNWTQQLSPQIHGVLKTGCSAVNSPLSIIHQVTPLLTSLRCELRF